jgi:hypothetical protein
MSNLKILFSYQLLRISLAVARVSSYALQNAFHKLHLIVSLSLIIGRVALVELYNDSSYPQISADITEALYQALQKRQIFGLSVVRQTDPVWRSLQLNLNSTYTPDKLSAIHKKLKCNAVLTGTITEYRPYPHMTIGLRLKLIDLRDGQLIWAVEQIWDTADKTTETRIKKYFEAQIRAGYAPLREQLLTISPLNFIKFVTYEVAATI